MKKITDPGNKIPWVHRTHHLVLAYSTVALAVATFLLAWATCRLQEEIDYSRANSSISLLLTTVDKFGNGLSCADFLIDMSDEEIRDILNYKRLPISNIHIDHLKRCLATSANNTGPTLESSKKETVLTEAGSAYIASQILHDLNLLEVISASYYSESSNKEIIRSTLNTLLTSSTIKIAIDKINKATAGRYYSSYIDRYISENKGYIHNKR